MPGEKPREIAVEVLTRRQQGDYIEPALDVAFARSELKPEDRRFLQELLYGVVRWERTLDWLISRKTRGKPQNPIIQNLLRSALYQMFWLDRVPSYAAVNETVTICKKMRLIPQSKFVNAVLRSYSREADDTRRTLAELRSTNLSLALSHPEWLCQRWETRWGKEKTARLLEWDNTTPPTYARVNTLKTAAEGLVKMWEEEGVQFQESSFSWIPPGTIFQLLKHPPLARLPSFQQGFFYIQDPSTLLAVHFLDPQPGENILDLCAAPGGKTTYIAQRMNDTGRVLAEDLDPKRLEMVAANCARLGAKCVTTRRASFSPNEPFDRVLVDAPCSNTGVMRRRVELRWRIKPEEIMRLSRIQRSLLDSAAKRLRPGGTLVYSTCSLEREENSAVVEEFLGINTRFKLDAERELNPVADNVDGAYCARLLQL